MEAPLGFGSNTERAKILSTTASQVGPGSYVLPSSIKKDLPAFVPFASTSSKCDCLSDFL